MKIVKKIVYVITFIIIVFVINSTILKAATTVKVTTDTLNVRKKASTESDIVTLLSQGDTCELIEENGDWYKIKYKNYTGYVSKEYVKKNEDTKQKDNDKKDTSKKDNSSDKKDDNKQDSTVTTGATIVKSTGKISAKTEVKIMPLIYSSKIGELAKNSAVTILTEMNGWAYVETDNMIGWIRSNSITGKKEVTTSTKPTTTQGDNKTGNADNQTTNKPEDNQQSADNKGDTSNKTDNDQTTVTEKTMYVAESAVNVRKEANTSSKIMMELALNTKLTVIGESGNWYQVKTTEGNGYVLKKLLSDKQKTTTRGGNLLNHANSTDEEKQTTKQTVNTDTKTTQVKNDNKTSSNQSSNQTTATKVSTTKDTNTTSKNNSSTSKKGKEVVEYAKKFLGVKYVYGGASKSGFDCSGFTMYVYKKFGISMRHGAQAQAKIGKAVKTDKTSAANLKKNLQPGDLVFFLDYQTMDEIGHCGIYIGDGKFIHASSGSGYCVKINSLLPGDYYNKRYCAARRVL